MIASSPNIVTFCSADAWSNSACEVLPRATSNAFSALACWSNLSIEALTARLICLKATIPAVTPAAIPARFFVTAPAILLLNLVCDLLNPNAAFCALLY